MNSFKDPIITQYVPLEQADSYIPHLYRGYNNIGKALYEHTYIDPRNQQAAKMSSEKMEMKTDTVTDGV